MVRRRRCKAFPGVRVTEDGRVFVEKERSGCVPVKPQVEGGYAVVRMRGKKAYVHRLVLLTFKGRPPKGTVAFWRNGDTLDNRLPNLCWEPRTEGVLRLAMQGKTSLEPDDVREMRRFIKAKWSLADIARKFKVSPRTVRHVRDGVTWGWLE